MPLSVPAAVAATAYVIHSEHHPPRPEYIADGDADADGDLYYVCWDAELVALLAALHTVFVAPLDVLVALRCRC